MPWVVHVGSYGEICRSMILCIRAQSLAPVRVTRSVCLHVQCLSLYDDTRSLLRFRVDYNAPCSGRFIMVGPNKSVFSLERCLSRIHFVVTNRRAT